MAEPVLVPVEVEVAVPVFVLVMDTEGVPEGVVVCEEPGAADVVPVEVPVKVPV